MPKDNKRPINIDLDIEDFDDEEYNDDDADCYCDD